MPRSEQYSSSTPLQEMFYGNGSYAEIDKYLKGLDLENPDTPLTADFLLDTDLEEYGINRGDLVIAMLFGEVKTRGRFMKRQYVSIRCPRNQNYAVNIELPILDSLLKLEFQLLLDGPDLWKDFSIAQRATMLMRKINQYKKEQGTKLFMDSKELLSELKELSKSTDIPILTLQATEKLVEMQERHGFTLTQIKGFLEQKKKRGEKTFEGCDLKMLMIVIDGIIDREEGNQQED